MEVPAIPSHSAGLLSARLSSIFPPSPRAWALDHFSFPSLLHSAQFCHCAKETNQKAFSLSASMPFFFFFSSFVSLCLPFLCLCPLSVWSAPRRFGTLNFDPRAHPAPCSLWCHGRSKGCWEVTRGQTSSCPARISGCCKLPILPFEESASLVWRKCLLFQEVGPAFLKSFKVAPWAPIFLLG